MTHHSDTEISELIERLRLGTKTADNRAGFTEYRSTALERKAATALQSLLADKARMEWQPIETAPLHREVLVCMTCESSGQQWITAATREDDGRWFNVSDGLMFPHSWQPLPEPPGTITPKEAE